MPSEDGTIHDGPDAYELGCIHGAREARQAAANATTETCGFCYAEVRAHNMRHHYRAHAEAGTGSGLYYRDRPLWDAIYAAGRELDRAEFEAKLATTQPPRT